MKLHYALFFLLVSGQLDSGGLGRTLDARANIGYTGRAGRPGVTRSEAHGRRCELRCTEVTDEIWGVTRCITREKL